jgi:hypothetical protein
MSPRCLFGLLAGLLAGAALAAEREYEVDYTIELVPAQDRAKVTIAVDDRQDVVSRFNFRIDPKVHTDFSADGELRIEGERVIWRPPARGGTLRLQSKVSHRRQKGDYDAYMDKDWAIFRGDDVIPAALVRAKKRAQSKAVLRFKLPPGWGVTTGWIKGADGTFTIDNPKRRFDRPVGWMIAGRIGIRKDRIGVKEVVVAAPDGSDLHRMDVLTFLNVVWPEAQHAFGRMPPKLLVVGAGAPMWRGGLSAPNSLFLHADRPLVSENGTSALLHELTHVVTRIRGLPNDDWIAEGLAEFYAIELLYRSGAMSETRYDGVRAWLRRWSRDVKSLRVKKSTGRVTARAVILWQDLDREIRERSKDERDIDDVTQALMRIGKVSLDDLRAAAEKAAGGKLKALDSPLLR